MSRFIIVFLFVLFIIYISICIYRFLMYSRIKIVFLRFMTSCMLLFTFTLVFYNDIFLDKDDIKSSYGEIYSKSESKVFLNSADKIIEVDNKQTVIDNQETENKITAYFDNTNPDRGTITNLIVTGPPGGKVTAICQFKGYGTPYIMSIGENGQVVIPVKVDSNAVSGYAVVVDISVSYGEKVYKMNSVFIPR